jgi:hypothetical protein
MAFRSQAQIDAVSKASIRWRREELHHFCGNTRKKLGTVDLAPAALSASFFIVQYQKVEVARVVEFFSSEFAESKHSSARGLSGGCHRCAQPGRTFLKGQLVGGLDRRIGYSTDVPNDILQ